MEDPKDVVKAVYTSVFDGDIVCESACLYNTRTKEVTDIDAAPNAEEADDANGLTDEYVTVGGEDLREIDGVVFEY